MTKASVDSLVEVLTDVDVVNKRVINLTQRLGEMMEEIASLKKKIHDAKGKS